MPRTLEQHNANDDCSPINTARAVACARAVERIYTKTGAGATPMQVCAELDWAWSPTLIGARTALDRGELEWDAGYVPCGDVRQPIDQARTAAKVRDLARRVYEAGGHISAEHLADSLGRPASFDEAIDAGVAAGDLEVICDGDQVMIRSLVVYASEAIAELEALLALEPALAREVEAA